MTPLERLVGISGSRLAALARYGLEGLRAQLTLALADEPADPAASEVRQALAALQTLLATAQCAAPPDRAGLCPVQPAALPLPPASLAPVVHETLPEGVSEPVSLDLHQPARLAALRELVPSADTLRSHLGAVTCRAGGDGELWPEVQRLLLRLPSSLAVAWRQQVVRIAQDAGAVLDHSPGNADVLPWTRDEEVYPGLSGAVQAPGLRLDRSAPLPTALGDLGLAEELRPLGCAVALALYFGERDSQNLYHALKSVDPFGVNPLADQEQRDRYMAELLFRLRRVAERDSGSPADALWARIDLDEAFCSLLYLPPVNRETSWWGRLQQEVRRTLDRTADRARQAGVKVQLQPLWGPYAKVCDRSSGDLEIDSGFPPGEVVASLRIFAQVNQEAIPGRVLHRSVRGR